MYIKPFVHQSCLAILAASALSFTTLSLADSSVEGVTAPNSTEQSSAKGFYVNLSAGLGSRTDKKLASAMSTAVNNLDPQIPGILVEAVDPHKRRTGFAGSVNLGYQFNQNFALEMGYMRLPPAERTEQANYGKDNSRIPDADQVSHLRMIRNTDAFTVAAKGIYPVNQQFAVFGKAGVALSVNDVTKTVGDNMFVTRQVPGINHSVTSEAHHVVPLLGLGADYNIGNGFAVELQGIATLKSGNAFPASYSGLLGLTYKFA